MSIRPLQVYRQAHARLHGRVAEARSRRTPRLSAQPQAFTVPDVRKIFISPASDETRQTMIAARPAGFASRFRTPRFPTPFAAMPARD